MAMELRHLRYFVAVVEEGSLTTAAELRLHTSQPSLSRQIRDLEYQVGAELLSRSVHGVELTAAGKAFLDHARLALMQVDAAVEAARRAAQPARKRFASPRRSTQRRCRICQRRARTSSASFALVCELASQDSTSEGISSE